MKKRAFQIKNKKKEKEYIFNSKRWIGYWDMSCLFLLWLLCARESLGISLVLFLTLSWMVSRCSSVAALELKWTSLILRTIDSDFNLRNLKMTVAENPLLTSLVSKYTIKALSIWVCIFFW